MVFEVNPDTEDVSLIASVLKVLIPALIGGIVGASLKFIFEKWLGPIPERKRTTKRIFRKYSMYLAYYTDRLDKRLNNFQKFADPKWMEKDEYYQLSTLYALGAFFGWCYIIENLVLLKFQLKGRKLKSFNLRFYTMYKGLTNFELLEGLPDNSKETILRDFTIKRFSIDAISEHMVVKNEEEFKVLNFTEFIQKYKSEEDLRVWFLPFVNLLKGIEKDEKHPGYNRFLIFFSFVRSLLDYLDKKNNLANDRSFEFISQAHPLVFERLRKHLKKAGITNISSKN